MTDEEFERRLAECFDACEEANRDGVLQFDGDEAWRRLMRDLIAEILPRAEQLPW